MPTCWSSATRASRSRIGPPTPPRPCCAASFGSSSNRASPACRRTSASTLILRDVEGLSTAETAAALGEDITVLCGDLRPGLDRRPRGGGSAQARRLRQPRRRNIHGGARDQRPASRPGRARRCALRSRASRAASATATRPHQYTQEEACGPCASGSRPPTCSSATAPPAGINDEPGRPRRTRASTGLARVGSRSTSPRLVLHGHTHPRASGGIRRVGPTSGFLHVSRGSESFDLPAPG